MTLRTRFTLIAILSCVLVIYGNLDFIVSLTNVTTLVTMALVNISAFILVRKEHLVPPEKTYFRIPLGAIIPALGFISCIFMLATLDPPIILLGLAIIIPGMAFYFVEDTPRGEKIRREIGRRLGRKVK